MLEVRGLRKVFDQGGTQTVAVGNLPFSLGEEEFVAIVGPSGCGRTTLLRCVAGLSPPTGGQVVLGGRPVVEPPPEMVLVFQDYTRSLCAWRKVLGNVLLALEHGGLTRAQQRRRAMDALRLVALDALTRAELEDQLLAIWGAATGSILFVTHDIEEAVYLADRVLILGPRPSEVVAELAIALPRPRHQLHTRADPRFVEYRNAIFTRIWAKETASAPAAAGRGA